MIKKVIKSLAVVLLVLTNLLSGFPIDLFTKQFGESILDDAQAAEIQQYSGGLLVYADGTAGTPKYKMYTDGSGFGSEQSATSVGAAAIEWIRVAASPTTDEWIIVTRDADDDIDAQVCTGVDGGVSCGSPTNITTTAGTHGFRNYDIAYEQLTGHALLVYGTATADELRKIEWTGSWGSDASITTTRTSGTVEWVELTARPASDQIGIAYADTGDDVSAYRWSGTAVGDEATSAITTGASTADVRKFDVSFEGVSGDMLVISPLAAVDTLASGTLVNTTWTVGTQTAVDNITAFVDMQEPGRLDNDIAMAAVGAAGGGVNPYEGHEWDGGAMVDGAIAVDAAVTDWAASYQLVAASYASATYYGVAVYSDNNDDVTWATMNAAGTWVLQTVNTRTRGTSRFVDLFDFPNSDKVLLLSADANSDLWADTWADTTPGASSWTDLTSGGALEDSLASATTDVVDFAFRLAPSSADPVPISQYSGGLLVYADGTSGTPKYKTYDDTAGFGAEQSASAVGAAIEWIRVTASPTDDEWIIATRDADDDIDAQVCAGVAGGVSCGAPTQITATAGGHGFRNFDVSYEQTSGDALLVYGTETADELRKIEWTGGSWSSDAAITTTLTSGTVEWVELTSRNGSNQIGIAYSDDADAVSAYRWSGNAVGDEATSLISSTAITGDFRKFDVSFEGTSGDMLVVAWVGAVGTARTGQLVNTTWTIGDQGGVDMITGFVDLQEPNPSDNDIAAFTHGAAASANPSEGFEWSGTAIVDGTAGDDVVQNWAASYQLGAVAYHSSTYYAVTAHSTAATADDIDWWTMNNAGTVTNQAVNSRTRVASRFIDIFDYPDADKVLLLTADQNSDLWADTWDGASVTATSWKDITTTGSLESELASATTDVVDFAFRLSEVVVGSPDIDQIHYRWRNDDGAEAGGGTPGAWFDSNWEFRKQILIDADDVAGGSDFSNFPMLVSLASDSDLAAEAQADADDIVFANDSGTQLDHQIESYNSGSGALVAWVKVDSMSTSSDTDIYMYYGYDSATNSQDPDSLWTDYEAVYHFAGDVLDSTSNNRDGTNNGTADIAGKVGNARDFTESESDYINLGTWSVSGSNLTMQGWVNLDTNNVGVDHRFISKGNGITEADHIWMVGENELEIRARMNTSVGSTTVFSATDPLGSTDVWYHFAATYDGTNIRLYVNGANVLTQGHTGTLDENTNPVVLGAQPPIDAFEDSYLDGLLDETRIADTWRSTDWITTEYNNQNSPSGFYDLAAEETEGASPATWAEDEDTLLADVPKLTNYRLRFELSNEGTDTNGGATHQLEVAETATCSGGSYAAVPTDTSGDWQISATTHFTDGDASTDVASGLTNESTTFVAGQLKDTGNTTSSITLDEDEFTEIEFSIQATSNATDEGDYCFRLTNADTYTVYAQATIEAGAGGPTFTQNTYRWYVDNDSTNPAAVWGTPDLAENTAIVLVPPGNDPPSVEQEMRLRVNLTVSGTLTISSEYFKLQYKAGTDASCTSGSWTDVNGGNAWTFATSSVTDGADITESLSTTTSGKGEEYVKARPATLNHVAANNGEIVEYDFHIIGGTSSANTQYSFRVVETDVAGTAETVLAGYTNCPTLTTEPGTGDLMRHGNVFSSGTERGFFWAD